MATGSAFPQEQAEAIAIACDILHKAGVTKPMPTIRVTAAQRGRWNGRNEVTLPSWLWAGDCSAAYRRYYIAHEIAHHVHGVHGHGLEFQLTLFRLAPDVWHYEAGYKPRLYAQAHVYLAAQCQQL